MLIIVSSLLILFSHQIYSINIVPPSTGHYAALVESIEKSKVEKYSERVSNSRTVIPSTIKDLPPAQFTWGGLYPHESPTRERKSLDGVWNFRLSPKDNPDQGFDESWFVAPLTTTGPVLSMPVPSSYNDVTQDITIRDHVGWAW